ncbi:transglycosylase SLT domain-containing protein [Vibrio sp. 10N.261.51.F12]|uniref:transglycosylase SLT domain-containing protein n=1 Tax=Vibrio sp. 10N.261.51.F12 TaxID=3229679 RepID=UPI0035540E17
MKYHLITVALFSTFVSFASDNPFSNLDREVQSAYLSKEAEQKQFQEWYKEHMLEYASWREEYIKRWDGERSQSIETWGDAQISDSHSKVVYDASNASRTVVDYEQETVTIEVIVDDNVDMDEMKIALQQQLTESLKTDTGMDIKSLATLDVSEASERSLTYDPDFEKQALQDIVSQTNSQLQQIDKEAELLAEQAGRELDPTIIDAQKTQLVSQAKTRMTSVSESFESQRDQVDPVRETTPKKKVVSLKIRMPSDSLKKRIDPYLSDIYHQSEVFNIKPELVLAIMHSESSFNPTARSPIPAFGLMQVVTTSAGHDVNRIVHKVDKPMNEADLYKPSYNIQAGTGYLDILNTRYLREIEDPKSREYCVIAAYNTGAGNVAKAFGERRIKSAAMKINTMTPDQVYDTLINNLPYEETINYLKKVTKRQKDYAAES